jgi:hypothetical protein
MKQKHCLRLVILDYPKNGCDSPVVRKIFGDMVFTKQVNFARSSDSYVSMSGLDMISSHVLIYDQFDLAAPKLIGAARICYRSRADKHQLRLPVDDYIDFVPPEYRIKFKEFSSEHKELVDANAWFVDPEYTFSNTGLKISEMIFFGLLQFMVRKGHTRWVGASNEKYKASRWALPTGTTEDGMIFKHPKVPDPHKLLLFKSLNYDWLTECTERYHELLNNSYEVLCGSDDPSGSACSVEEFLIRLNELRARGVGAPIAA